MNETITLPDGFLNNIKTNKGVTLGEINKRHKILLMFLRHTKCLFCKEALKDISEAYLPLIQHNTVPIVVHIETPEFFSKFITKFADGDAIMLNLLSAYDKDFVLSKQFRIVSANDNLKEMLRNLPTTIKRAAQTGYTQNPLTANSGPDPGRIPSLFIIEQGKIVNEHRHRHIGERPDYIKFMIDPENYGLQIDTAPVSRDMFCDGVYCEMRRPEKKKEKNEEKKSPTNSYSCLPAPREIVVETLTLQDVLSDTKKIRFFHVFAARSQASENVMFIQQVNKRYKRDDQLERERVAKNIFEVFFDSESLLELNVKQSSKNNVMKRFEEEGPVIDLFDDIARDIENHVLVHLFALFTDSDCYTDMIMKTQSV
ncbi:regulator of G-protein signaling [Acrasis kona]|uniref:Regulator of G-protein signaling n=1 Tax=Acrasis kona TaxID=1008807 RepID=A0AAW2ZNZ4_9EUKA